MKKGILCILVIFAMSIGNWNYGQFPGWSDKNNITLDLDGTTSGGSSASNGISCGQSVLVRKFTPVSGVRGSLYAIATMVEIPGLNQPLVAVSSNFIHSASCTGSATMEHYSPNPLDICNYYTNITSYTISLQAAGMTYSTSGQKSIYWNLSGSSCPC